MSCERVLESDEQANQRLPGEGEGSWQSANLEESQEDLIKMARDGDDCHGMFQRTRICFVARVGVDFDAVVKLLCGASL